MAFSYILCWGGRLFVIFNCFFACSHYRCFLLSLAVSDAFSGFADRFGHF